MGEARRRSWHPRSPWTFPGWTAPGALVGITATGLFVSYLVTWDLWFERTSPPNLALAGPLSAVPFGPLLCGVAVLAVAVPRWAATAHAALLVLAVLGDQVRLQPEFVSLAMLLLVGAWAPRSLEIGRWHLTTLWAWAGIHKILSLGWPSGGAAFIAAATGEPRLRPVVAVLVPLCEVGLAGLALSTRTWHILRLAAPVFHLGIVLTLVKADWNLAVWPWNLALAAAAPALFRSPSTLERTPGVPRSPLVAATAALLAIYPLGFYFGYSNAYLSHNLYSSNSAEASICPPEPGRCAPAPFSTWERLNVPLPPERRLFIAWFDTICTPGQRLRIDGPQTRLSERRRDSVACTRTSPGDRP